MLFRNNMRPAFATAGADAHTGSTRSKIKDFLTRSEHSADDDFNSFGSASAEKQQRTAPPRQERPSQGSQRPPQRRRRRPSSQLNWRPIIIIAAVVLALAIILPIAFTSSCGSSFENFEASDNVFATFVDAKGKYHIVSNGEVLEETFSGEVKLTPSANGAFAYVEVKVANGTDSGIEMYILQDDELEKVRVIADEVIAYADYEPGIIYRDDQFYMHYTLDEEFPIIGTNASMGITPKNFFISGDANTVAYTTTDASNNHTYLYYFSDGISLPVTPANDFTPVKMSMDGSYIYGIKYSGYDIDEDVFTTQSLVYVYTEDQGETFSGGTVASLNSYGALDDINGINVDGTEIIFATKKESYEDGPTTVSTYLYQIGAQKPILLGEGTFTPVYTGNGIACPETFIDTYFECDREVTTLDEEGDPTTEQVEATFVLTEAGTKKIADAKGQFSPDNEYFYYVDKTTTNLMRTPLDSDNYAKDSKTVMNFIHSFCIIENGDLYIMRNGGSNLGYISYYDSSTGKPLTVDSKVDINSMSQCADSIFFSKTDAKGNTVIYIATESATAEIAEFEDATPAVAPTVKMGSGNKGYIYIKDKAGKDYLFYTTDGTDFSNVAEGPCRIPGFSSTAAAPAN